MENNEVLYKSEDGFKSSLADVLATAKNIEATIKSLIEQVNAKSGNKRIEWLESELAKQQNFIDQIKERNGKLMAENHELRIEYYNKPYRETIKIVPFRVAPRDCFDLQTHSTIAMNHIFRAMNDPSYMPEEKFNNQFKSKLRTTVHLDPNI